MREPLVRADGLGRSFGNGEGRVAAVTDVTFSVNSGDRIALVGPSGSGKSTLLQVVAGLDRPTSGSIGWPALGPRDDLRPGMVAIAFQDPSLLPPLTVLENVALPVILAGGSEGEAVATARDLLEIFEVATLAEHLPEELSGGQAQRASIARAFSGSPRLVLADEPTGQQDQETAARLVEAILTLGAIDDTTLLVATHDAAVADRLPARWTMRDGRLVTEALTCSA